MRIEVLASGSSGNAYWVSDGTTHLLLECGIVRKQIAAAIHEMKLPGIDACLVSHSHADHSKAVKEFLRLGIECYMSKGTAEALEVTERVHIVAARDWVYKGTWIIQPFAVEHDAAEPLAFVLQSNLTAERLLYATDTQYISPIFEALNIIALEANYSLPLLKDKVHSGEVHREIKHRVLWNHQSIETVLKFLERLDKSRLQAVYLLHLSDANSDEQAFKKAAQEICGCAVHVC